MTLAIDSRIQERRQKIPFFCPYQWGFKRGRRKIERRDEAGRGRAVYVDLYAGHLMVCVVGVLVLSICDAVLTLRILASGGIELNPLMSTLIDDNIEKFVAVKMALTSLALVMLVIHHNALVFKKLRVWHLKYVMLTGYAALIGYELYLLALCC